MRFLQHVYGSVSRGVQGSLPGYQVAGLTAALEPMPELVDALNRLSFFTRSADAEPARLSFFRPVPGFVAFGRAVLAEDLSGSVGSFAHNFVCAESELLASDAPVASLLQSFQFLGREEDLPDDRSLPEVEVVPAGPGPRAGNRELALQLLDLHLGEHTGHVPMVIAGEAKALGILGDLFELLPRLEAVSVSFSTMFVDATELAPRFRLVFVPRSDLVPSGSYVYRLVDPATASQARPVAPTPLGQLWRFRPEQAFQLRDLADSLRSGRDVVTAMRVLHPMAPEVRQALDALGVQQALYRVLASSLDWAVAYARAGGGLDGAMVTAVVLEQPDERLVLLLEAARQLGDERLRERIFKSLATEAARGAVELGFLQTLRQARELSSFYGAVSRSLDSGELAEVAVTLVRSGLYEHELHGVLADRLLEALRPGRRPPSSIEALQQATPASAALAAYLLAVVDTAAWAAAPRRLELRLRGRGLRPEHHERLVQAIIGLAVGAEVDLDTLVRTVWSEEHSLACLSVLGRFFGRSGPAGDAALLGAILGRPGLADEHHRLLVGRIAGLEKSAELARLYLRALGDPPRAPEDVVTRLRALGSKRGGFFGFSRSEK